MSRAFQTVVPQATSAPVTRHRSFLSQPYGALVVAADTCYFLPTWIPPDVTRVRVGVALRDAYTIAGNAADVTSQKIAIGTPNTALSDFAVTPQVETGITYPAVGCFGYSSWYPVKPNDAGYIAIAYTVPAGSYYGEALQYYGYSIAGTDPSSFSGGAALATPCGAVFIEYDTAAPRVVLVGDSLTRALGNSGEAGYLNGYHQLGPKLGLAVACNGIASTTVASWNAPTTSWLTPDNYWGTLQGATVVIQAGTNDLFAGTGAPAIIGNIVALSNTVRAQGAKRVIVCTVAPSSTYSAPQNVQRGYINPWVRSLPDYLDVDAIVRDPNTPTSLLYPCTGNVHYRTQSYTDIVAAMVAGTYLPGGLPY